LVVTELANGDGSDLRFSAVDPEITIRIGSTLEAAVACVIRGSGLRTQEQGQMKPQQLRDQGHQRFYVPGAASVVRTISDFT
jgi:hypothetical protein